MKTTTVQQNGQVGLPASFRKRFGIKKGDKVVWEETENGLIVQPQASSVLEAYSKIGEAMQDKGITLEQLIEDGREIRGELLQELYGLDENGKRIS